MRVAAMRPVGPKPPQESVRLHRLHRAPMRLHLLDVLQGATLRWWLRCRRRRRRRGKEPHSRVLHICNDRHRVVSVEIVLARSCRTKSWRCSSTTERIRCFRIFFWGPLSDSHQTKSGKPYFARHRRVLSAGHAGQILRPIKQVTTWNEILDSNFRTWRGQYEEQGGANRRMTSPGSKRRSLR